MKKLFLLTLILLFSLFLFSCPPSISPPTIEEPNAPSNLAVNAVSGTQIDLEWVDNSENEAGFKIEEKIGADGDYSQIVIVDANTTAYSHSGLSPGTTYYYRVKAFNAYADSSYSNEISVITPPVGSIDVASPNGGEVFELSSTHNITWSSSNAGSNVKIELYKSGSYYETISSSTSNNGSYSWSIPTSYTESSDYKIKITDTSNSSINDDSDNYFTLSSQPPPPITVASPNGGENWELGSNHSITWSISNAGSNVKIELYKSGSYYKTISSSTSNNGSYSWSIPTSYTESSDYKIKITDTSNSSINDDSDSYFTLSSQPPPPTITVTSPNGGENWEPGSTHNITWSSNNAGSNVKIELYKSGSYYKTISSSTSNDGSYSWSIPTSYTESSQYKIKITDTGNSSTYDYSNSYFTLSSQPPPPTITVTSPNGGENWQQGITHNIAWSSSNAGSNVKIELYRIGSWYRTISSSTSNDGSYSFQITGCLDSDQYKIKITDTSNSSTYDYSDGYFALYQGTTGDIIVISPNGGENWCLSLTHNIIWSTSDAGSYVKIELYESAYLYKTISSSTSNDGSYNWLFPSSYTASSNYRIKITDTSNSSIYDFSDAFFTLSSPTITVTSPNGGENWYLGSTHNITWSTSCAGSYVKIELYKSDIYYKTISSSTSNDGSYSWSIPSSYTASIYYKIKITDTSNSSTYDYSNSYFKLSKPTITITSPNGGEIWELGSTHNITWTSSGTSDYVKIELHKGGSYITISSSTYNDGNYSWTIPSFYGASSNYSINIKDLNNSSWYDYSNGYFTLFSVKYGQDYDNHDIPDYPGEHVSSEVNVSGAPSGAAIIKFKVYYEIRHTYPRDLDVWLTSYYDGGWHDYYLYHHGDLGSADDIVEFRDNIHLWDGASPNNHWYLCVKDYASMDTGYIDELQIWIFWVE